MTSQITISIVSHGQNWLVNQLIDDLVKHCADRLSIVLTENIRDAVGLRVPRGIRTEVLVNTHPKGFGANHNAAFRHCDTPYFAVVNPDIRLRSDPFPHLLRALQAARVAVAAPIVLTPEGTIEDSARRYPTIAMLLRKALQDRSGPDYPTDRGPIRVDWAAGMFLLLRSEAYRSVGGFNERYFLYYEDVDLCRRLNSNGWQVMYEPRAEVVHEARRASRRKMRYAVHHALSAARFLLRR